jgi:hypothetical protein
VSSLYHLCSVPFASPLYRLRTFLASLYHLRLRFTVHAITPFTFLYISAFQLAWMQGGVWGGAQPPSPPSTCLGGKSLQRFSSWIYHLRSIVSCLTTHVSALSFMSSLHHLCLCSTVCVLSRITFYRLRSFQCPRNWPMALTIFIHLSPQPLTALDQKNQKLANKTYFYALAWTMLSPQHAAPRFSQHGSSSSLICVLLYAIDYDTLNPPHSALIRPPFIRMPCVVPTHPTVTCACCTSIESYSHVLDRPSLP